MTKNDRYFQLMSEKHAELFAAFDPIHQQFEKNRSNEDAFHNEGQKVVDVIRSWERRLCSGMERGQHAQYSQRLAEKFWTKVKVRYPLIEMVGLKSKNSSSFGTP